MKDKKSLVFLAVVWLNVVSINPGFGLICYHCSSQTGTSSEGECQHPKLVENITCQANKICVTMEIYTADKELYSVTKGCLANCTNKWEQDPSSRQRRFQCCKENLCNIKRNTTTPPAAVLKNSTETTKTTKGCDNAASRKSPSVEIVLITFLAFMTGKFRTE